VATRSTSAILRPNVDAAKFSNERRVRARWSPWEAHPRSSIESDRELWANPARSSENALGLGGVTSFRPDSHRPICYPVAQYGAQIAAAHDRKLADVTAWILQKALSRGFCGLRSGRHCNGMLTSGIRGGRPASWPDTRQPEGDRSGQLRRVRLRGGGTMRRSPVQHVSTHTQRKTRRRSWRPRQRGPPVRAFL
jgi:hypothetical protein